MRRTPADFLPSLIKIGHNQCAGLSSSRLHHYPLTIRTFGLFLFVIHAFMLKLSASIVSGFRANGFVPALYGSILLTLMDLVLSIFI